MKACLAFWRPGGNGVGQQEGHHQQQSQANESAGSPSRHQDTQQQVAETVIDLPVFMLHSVLLYVCCTCMPSLCTCMAA
jgi:hypothetical protein